MQTHPKSKQYLASSCDHPDVNSKRGVEEDPEVEPDSLDPGTLSHLSSTSEDKQCVTAKELPEPRLQKAATVSFARACPLHQSPVLLASTGKKQPKTWCSPPKLPSSAKATQPEMTVKVSGRPAPGKGTQALLLKYAIGLQPLPPEDEYAARSARVSLWSQPNILADMYESMEQELQATTEYPPRFDATEVRTLEQALSANRCKNTSVEAVCLSRGGQCLSRLPAVKNPRVHRFGSTLESQ
jgi:hypothetical protein